jgi:hypothetical protein
VVEDRLAFFTADATAETVYTNVAGTIARVTNVVCANPSTGTATTIRLTLGVDGATTRWLFIPIPAGENTQIVNAEQTYEGVEVMQAGSSLTDDVVVVSVNGYKRLVS